MEMDFKGDNILMTALFVIAMSVSGWALLQCVDLNARLHVVEAVSVTERGDNDRRFNELTSSIKQMSEKLDRIERRLGDKN